MDPQLSWIASSARPPGRRWSYCPISFPPPRGLCRAMSLTTKGFLRAVSRYWYPAGRCFRLWLERPSRGHLRRQKGRMPIRLMTVSRKLKSCRSSCPSFDVLVEPGLPEQVPETWRLAVSERRQSNAIHDADDPERLRKGRTGRHAGRKGRRSNDEVQRIPPEGGGAARARWLASALDGRSGLVFRREAKSDRRPLHRSEGGTRRLLEDSGEIKRRGSGMCQAVSGFG